MVQPPINPFDSGSRGIARRHGAWSLCFGAGICMGVLPSWRDLTRELLNATAKTSYDATQFDQLVASTGWGFDAWIQTALNALSQQDTPVAFADLVEQALYAPIREIAAQRGVEAVLGDAFQSPEHMPNKDLHAVVDLIDNLFRDCSVRPLARVLAASIDNDAEPQAVLSFNYDAILETMIKWLRVVPARDRGEPTPPAAFRRVTGPAGTASGGRGRKIPFYYLHGCVLPKPSERFGGKAHDSRDRIIAQESSYINIATTAFAWPQAIFLYHALNDGLIIVGQSLSDPNVRRWLAWAATSRSHRRPPHIWIRTRPADANEATVLEASVAHLGLRIAWLGTWAELEPALENLLALPTSA